MTPQDHTDTNWTHALGTERLRVVHWALSASFGLLAKRMCEEASADLDARLAWNQKQGDPWWPLTDLERIVYGKA